MNNIITISREFGSGGREVGRRLADYLGYDYYDREIIEHVANENNMDKGYVAKVLESSFLSHYSFTFSRSFTFNNTSNMNAVELMASQYEFVKQVAEKSNCIIVGRGADAILEDYHPFRIFVYADMDAKVARCKERANEDEKGLTDKDYIKKIKQIDRNRAENHNFYSSIKWGNKEGYELCVNTTNQNIKTLAPAIGELAKVFFENNK